MDLIEAQKQRERETFEALIEKNYRRDLRAASEGRGSAFERTVVGEVLERLKKHCEEILEATLHKRGKKAEWEPMRPLGADVLSALALRLFVSTLVPKNPPALLTVLNNGGNLLVVALAALDEEKRGVKPKLKEARRSAQQRVRSMTKGGDDEEPQWTQEKRVKAGAILWDLMVLAGLVTLRHVEGTKRLKGNLKKTVQQVVTTPKGFEVLQAAKTSSSYAALLSPNNRPMISPPLPWKGYRGGGYLTKALRSPLIRGLRPAVRKEVSEGLKGAQCLEAVNLLQAVPLRINEDALWLREYAWDNQIDLGTHTPRRSRIPVPEVPDMSDWVDRDRFRFLAKRRRILDMNRAVPALEAQWASDAQEAEGLFRLREADTPFYLPHNLDFRGRTYATPSFSHQRGDAVKGLFEFHRGVPLGKHGLDGLKIHVANTCDFDKISKGSFKERIAWVDENLDLLLSCAKDPERFRLWARPDCDAPFSFFAAICDLERALSSGDPHTYVSHIRVDLDGSNSGVQHYAAMLRAYEGILVSLYPSSRPMDLYASVAKRALVRAISDGAGLAEDPDAVISAVKEALSDIREACELEERKPEQCERDEIKRLKALRDQACAQQWTKFGITRSTVKRSTMTYNYSSEAFGFGQHIMEDLMDPMTDEVTEGKLEAHPFGDDEGRAASSYLGRVVFSEVEKLLPKVAEAMRWLKGYGYLMGKKNIPVRLKTPDGFPMVFRAEEEQLTRIKVSILMGLTRSDFRPFVDGQKEAAIVPLKQKSGTAPQVIHECDGYHLRCVVRRVSEVTPDIATIHDSFGVHAAHWKTLARACVETLVWCYADWNPLEDLAAADGYDGPPVPERGNLDMQKVLKASYAFS